MTVDGRKGREHDLVGSLDIGGLYTPTAVFKALGPISLLL